MEKMDMPLFKGQMEEPEKTEYEPGSPEEMVSNWIEEYTETHQQKDLGPYELSPEVGAWFAEYENRKEKGRDEASSSQEWKKLYRELEAEYDEKLKQKEYELYVLQQVPQESEKRNEYQIKKLSTWLSKQAQERWWEEHKDEIPPRNVLTHFEDTATAMADIEGLGWAGGQSRENFSLLGALKYIKNHADLAMDKSNAYEVYGDGGFNRWFVNAKGDVLFAKHFARGSSKEEIAANVARRGFGIF